MTSIIILSYNTLEMLRMCLESIRVHTLEKYELIVVDNASTDGSLEYLREQPDVRLIENKENMGFPKGCNQGLAIAGGDSLLLLNSDTVVTENWLGNLQKGLYSNEKVGAVSCLSNYVSNNQQIPVTYGTDMEAMQSFAARLNHSDPDKWEERPHLVGFCYMFRREIYETIGGLDERFALGNFEDNDYSLRILEKGYKLLLLKDTFIHHWGSSSFKKAEERIKQGKQGGQTFLELNRTNMQKFFEKWQLPYSYLHMRASTVRELMHQLAKQTPVISVVIPVYNVEKYVSQCIDSILNQTFKAIELIVIDDASTDNSYELIKSRYGNLKKLCLERNEENIGLAATRNKGIKMAKGKYVYFIDSDDILAKRALEDMYFKAEECQADMVHMSGWYQTVKEDFTLDKVEAEAIRDKDYHQQSVQFPCDLASRILECFIKRKYLISAWINLYRRDFLIENNIYFPDMIYEDNPFIFACYAASERIFTIPGVYYIYRQRKGSITHDGSYKRLKGAIEAILVGCRYIKETAAKRGSAISDDLIYNAQIALFREIWPAVLMFYDGGNNIPSGTIEAVENVLKKYFPCDYSFVSILLHHDATINRRLGRR